MLKNLLALAGLTLSLSANAAIVSIDSSFGADTITRDTATGLDWLDVTETLNLSYNEVTAQLGSGGAFEGYRYATEAELGTLISNFGYVAQDQNCDNGALFCDTSDNVGGQGELVEVMIRTLGDTLDAFYATRPGAISSEGAGYVTGLLERPELIPTKAGSAQISDAEFSVIPPAGFGQLDGGDIVLTQYGLQDLLYSNVAVGSFLVAPSPVPVPAAAWLFVTALLGLVGLKRRRGLH